MERYLVVVGTEAHGFYHYGPFDSEHDAEKWGQTESAPGGLTENESWAVRPLNLP